MELHEEEPRAKVCCDLYLTHVSSTPKGTGGKDTTGDQEEEGSDKTRVRLLKGNPLLGLGRKITLRMNTCQDRSSLWRLPLETASLQFPARPTVWEVTLVASQQEECPNSGSTFQFWFAAALVVSTV